METKTFRAQALQSRIADCMNACEGAGTCGEYVRGDLPPYLLARIISAAKKVLSEDPLTILDGLEELESAVGGFEVMREITPLLTRLALKKRDSAGSEPSILRRMAHKAFKRRKSR